MATPRTRWVEAGVGRCPMNAAGLPAVCASRIGQVARTHMCTCSTCHHAPTHWACTTSGSALTYGCVSMLTWLQVVCAPRLMGVVLQHCRGRVDQCVGERGRGGAGV